jgi:hypothetical protein
VGIYNPYIPQILGQEWCPIRDEDIIFSQTNSSFEQGTSFTLNSSRQTPTGKFYINEPPGEFYRFQPMTMNIYPKGQEAQSGPIMRLVVPCNVGLLTGSAVLLAGSSTVAEAVLNPSAPTGIRFPAGFGVAGSATFFFNMNAVIGYLTGGGSGPYKRIVGFNCLYNADYNLPSGVLDRTQEVPLSMGDATNVDLIEFSDIVYGPQWNKHDISRIQLGTVNPFFGSAPLTNNELMEWTPNELLRFEQGSSGPLHLMIDTIADADPGPDVIVSYMALEIFYCEERRVATGSHAYNGIGGSVPVRKTYIQGANPIVLRTAGSGAANPVLAAGDYTMTITQSNVGDNILALINLGPEPKLNALRELYPIPTHEGVIVNVPFPPTPEIEGQTMTRETTHILPQLSLHASGASGAAFLEPHVYGRQAKAQVDTVTQAEQDILDSVVPAAPYPQVRFYARRFGDTTVPLLLNSTTAFPTSAVTISPDDFDELPEIIDGWKEVTLRFEFPPTMGGTGNPTWRFSAPTESKGNRWEILGAAAIALSGQPGNLYVLAPGQLGPATYGQPVSGTGINLNWYPGLTFAGSSNTDDITADAVLLFSQDPAAVSGFGVTNLNQALTGIGLNCGLPPAFIPTALAYNQLAWSLDPVNQLSDIFSRTVASGWGTATSGQTWTASGGSATDFSVSSGAGRVLMSTTNAYRITRVNSFSAADVDAYAEISSDTKALGVDHWGSIAVRDNGAGDQIYAAVEFSPSNAGTVTLNIRTVVAGAHTLLGAVVFAKQYTLNRKVKVRLQVQGTNVNAKAWMDGDIEPDHWLLQLQTLTNSAAGTVATRTIAGSGSPTGMTVSYDNIVVNQISLNYTEIQRMDTVDTTWKTIMKATNQGVQSFNDYEARVGILTSYRIRKVNVYEFPGAWSSTITTTLAAPGVTATGMTADDHVWIFTTNSIQNGSSNLAYCLGWDGEVSEDFNFPESSGQVFQAVYNRNYVTVFRPTERGGTNFTRNLLVQAAAISPETLEDFTSLRDMAWVDVPYICLRDEDGNRWFSNVSVVGGTVLRGRRLYMAPVSVVEVTDTPTPVDP